VRERTAREEVPRGPGPQRDRQWVRSCIERGGQVNALMPKGCPRRDLERQPKVPSATPTNLRPKPI
jgi:hypothetical protein